MRQSARGSIGRDQLCRVIMEDIHHSDTRRPHLLIGGVGAGKTAVLVRLTRLLAERHAVPVPIRLRDATEGLNFREMAHARFLAMAETSMLSADDAEKVWRQLSKDDKIVVIAAETSGPSTRRNWGWSSASAMRFESSPTVPPAA